MPTNAPARTTLVDTYPNPSTATYKAGIGQMWDWLTGLLGTSGSQAQVPDGAVGSPVIAFASNTGNGLYKKATDVLGVSKALDVAGALTLAGTITSTKDGVQFTRTGASTGVQYIIMNNTGGGIAVGVESSAGGGLATGSTAYAAIVSATNSAPALQTVVGGAVRTSVDTSGHVTPGADNTQTMGSGSKRWSTVYAGTGAINTSDGFLKKTRGELTDAEVRAWSRVRPLIFQFLDAIQAKGEDKARLHAGMIAQEVEAAFKAEGLDPARYALWCRDEVFEEVQKVLGEEMIDEPVLEEVEEPFERIEVREGVPHLVVGVEKVWRQKTELRNVIGDDGQPVMVPSKEGSVPLTVEVPVTRRVSRQVMGTEKVSKGFRYGLRYDQCLVFEAAYTRVRLAEMEKRLQALEEA